MSVAVQSFDGENCEKMRIFYGEFSYFPWPLSPFFAMKNPFSKALKGTDWPLKVQTGKILALSHKNVMSGL